jgi:tRNA modification GTPase
MSDETIAAIATAPGSGGIGIIRLSGDKALAIGVLLTGITPAPRHAHLCDLRDMLGQKLDTGICLFFPGPHSFTGEDVVELQVHGGPVILDLILREVCQHGARIARPGEFSHRAYLNNKIDLVQAEAIADLINASTHQAALNASRTLQGVFSHKINVLVELITNLRVYVEAAIDFPEEEIDFMKNHQVEERLEEIILQLDAVRGEAKQGSIIQEGMKVVIAGKPNAGKSSLLNALSGENTAIVSSIEGTTRDVLRTRIQIDGMPLHIVDTAGLRESRDEIEQEGIRRAWAEIETADRILLVVDSSAPTESVNANSSFWPGQHNKLAKDIPVVVIANKCDLSNYQPRVEHLAETTTIHVSAKTGAGIDLLRQHLKSCMGYRDGGDGNFSARRRHLVALDRAGQFLLSGQQQLLETGSGELLAEDLRLCQNCLGEITEAVSSDEMLGKIFSSFCIGK